MFVINTDPPPLVTRACCASATPPVALLNVQAPLWLLAGVKIMVPVDAPETYVPPVIRTASAVPVPLLR